MGLLASTCITGCGYEVNVTKKEPVEVSDDKVEEREAERKSDKSKKKDVDDVKDKYGLEDNKTDGTDNKTDGFEGLEGNKSDAEDAEDKGDAEDVEDAEDKGIVPDTVQLENVAVSDYRLMHYDDGSNAVLFAESDVANSDVVVMFDYKTFASDSDEAMTYKLTFQSKFDSSVMDMLQESGSYGSVDMGAKLDDTILEDSNVIIVDTSEDVSIAMWGEEIDDYYLFAAMFAGPGAHDVDNIKEFITSVDVNGEPRDTDDIKLMTKEEFLDVNDIVGDPFNYIDKLKEGMSERLGGLGDKVDIESNEEADSYNSKDLEAEDIEVSGDLMAKSLKQGWYKDFGVLNENVYVGFSTLKDFEDSTGLTPTKVKSLGDMELRYYKHNNYIDFYIVVDTETSRIKSASYSIEDGSRPTTDMVKSKYGTPDKDGDYIKYEVTDEYNSVSCVFYLYEDKVVNIELSSVIID